MELIEFLGLKEEEQWEEFCEHCVFITKFHDLERKHHLFMLHGFFVELVMDNFSKTQKSMNAFIFGPRLDKYFEREMAYIEKILQGNNSLG
ncbi:MAG: hypothetical protein AAF575_00155 [Bacteroidota bacterium]